MNTSRTPSRSGRPDSARARKAPTQAAICALWPQEWATPPGAPVVGRASMSATMKMVGPSLGPTEARRPVTARPRSTSAPTLASSASRRSPVLNSRKPSSGFVLKRSPKAMIASASVSIKSAAFPLFFGMCPPSLSVECIRSLVLCAIIDRNALQVENTSGSIIFYHGGLS